MNGLSIGRPIFVKMADVLAWHHTALAQYGGAPGLRDSGLLESALAQPQQGFGGQFAHAFPFEMAAAYAFHIAKNHPFMDGNKRAALLCCGAFLRMNGWNLESKGLEAAEAILKLVDGTMNKSAFADWLREHCHELPTMELRDFFRLLSPEQHFAFIQSATLTRGAGEIRATLQEAANAIPLLLHLGERHDALLQEGKRDAALLFAGHINMLVALFRVAEDFGYEW